MDQKLIEKGIWWEEGVELVSGCNPCSIGCDNCWSAAMTHHFKGSKGPILTAVNKEMDIPPYFTGNIVCHPERLKRFNTRKPKVFAVWNDMGHPDAPYSFFESACLAMLRFERHKYVILTKRPQNMSHRIEHFRAEYISTRRLSTWRMPDNFNFGLTICTQAEADEKIPVFSEVPGNTFLCIEPMLGPITLWDMYLNMRLVEHVDAVICGTETGPYRRPAKLEWIESIIDQCDAAGVPVFVTALEINGKVSKDMAEWPEKFRRRELPWL